MPWKGKKAENLDECQVHLRCFPSLKDGYSALQAAQCLKTITLHILPNFIVICYRTVNPLPLLPLSQTIPSFYVPSSSLRSPSQSFPLQLYSPTLLLSVPWHKCVLAPQLILLSPWTPVDLLSHWHLLYVLETGTWEKVQWFIVLQFFRIAFSKTFPQIICILFIINIISWQRKHML